MKAFMAIATSPIANLPKRTYVQFVHRRFPVLCPKCSSDAIYPDGPLMICPLCAHEWVPGENAAPEIEKTEDPTIRDANGVALESGDSVVLTKDLKIKGSSTTLKSGTKVKSIRLQDDVDGHNLSCRIDGVGSINLKSEFVKKI
jgi:protein PhnA